MASARERGLLRAFALELESAAGDVDRALGEHSRKAARRRVLRVVKEIRELILDPTGVLTREGPTWTNR